jgi:hypothetical protein
LAGELPSIYDEGILAPWLELLFAHGKGMGEKRDRHHSQRWGMPALISTK